MNRTYICIDLKSFYASVECRERNLDPLNTNLVVADSSRTEKTICLAVSPSLKQYKISGRARLFEVIQKVKEINIERLKNNNYYKFTDKSFFDNELKQNKNLELDYIVAPPRMKKYMEYSTNIYNVYLKFIAPEDIFVYSIDEVFCDITNYLNTYNMTKEELVSKMIQEVYNTTGITATAGIGTNLYLAKIAMDIVAKHAPANEIGVRLANLDEMSYRKCLWTHKPLTDFWRVGPGITKKLETNKLYTMGDIALCSTTNEELLYKLFGIQAELLIDHAWGYEPCTMESIKSYKPSTNSMSSGQVLQSPYDYDKTRLIIREMADSLSLDLVSKDLVTNQLTLTVIYDVESLKNPLIKCHYFGPVIQDHYGRSVPKPSHGTVTLDTFTSSTKTIVSKILSLYDKITDNRLLVRKLNISANNLINKELVKEEKRYEQFNLFTNYDEIDKKLKQSKIDEIEENKVQKVVLELKNKYGKNAVLKGMNLEKYATAIERNKTVGGHKE